MMAKRLITDQPVEIPIPVKQPEIIPHIDPEEPIIPEEDPDVNPEEDPNTTPPYEIPLPGGASKISIS